MASRNLTQQEWERYLGDEPYRATCPHAPIAVPAVDAGTNSLASAEHLPPTTATTFAPLDVAPVAIVEEFDSDQGFIQTSPNVYIADGQVKWHVERAADAQYIYRSIPPFNGNVRLKVRGQVDSWTNNCGVWAGIGNEVGRGLIVTFGWTGGGCPTNGPFIEARNITWDNHSTKDCEFLGDWLWIDSNTPYTAELAIIDELATLSVDGVGSATGAIDDPGPYTHLWVGYPGDGDWPECEGTIDAVIVEPLD
jgi:hypothetical protein